jgi:hypothetical protein
MVIPYGHYGSDLALPTRTNDHLEWLYGETPRALVVPPRRFDRRRCFDPREGHTPSPGRVFEKSPCSWVLWGYQLLEHGSAAGKVFSCVTSWGSLMETRPATSFPLLHPSDTSGRRHYPRKRIPRYSSPAETRKPSWTLGFLYTLWDRPR